MAHAGVQRVGLFVLLSLVFVIAPRVGVAQVRQGDRVTLTNAAVGCVWEVQEKVRDYALAKDNEAVKRLWLAGVMAGKCDTFSKGDQVIVMERSLWHNMTRIKKVGAIGDYWIAGQPE